MTITLTQKQYKAIKKEIVETSARWVGFNYGLFDKVNHYTMLEAIDEAVQSGVYLSMDEIADKDNFLATEIVRHSNYQDFKELAPYFFSFSAYARANKEKLLNTVLEDDTTSSGGTSFVGETLADFLSEVGKEEEIPYTFSDQWLKDVNEMLIECGIKPLAL